MGIRTIKAAVEICVELLRGMPLWAFWVISLFSALSGFEALKVLIAIMMLGWAPAISYCLKERFLGAIQHRSLRLFIAFFTTFILLAAFAYTLPDIWKHTWVKLPLIFIMTSLYFRALWNVARELSELEVYAKLAQPEEVGRNTFGGFLCIFYFAFGGMVLINKRLKALDSATKSHAPA